MIFIVKGTGTNNIEISESLQSVRKFRLPFYLKRSMNQLRHICHLKVAWEIEKIQQTNGCANDRHFAIKMFTNRFQAIILTYIFFFTFSVDIDNKYIDVLTAVEEAKNEALKGGNCAKYNW